jgi:hypothetical protein
MQSIGQMNGKNMKHKMLIIGVKNNYFARNNCGEDNAQWYF